MGTVVSRTQCSFWVEISIPLWRTILMGRFEFSGLQRSPPTFLWMSTSRLGFASILWCYLNSHLFSRLESQWRREDHSRRRLLSSNVADGTLLIQSKPQNQTLLDSQAVLCNAVFLATNFLFHVLRYVTFSWWFKIRVDLCITEFHSLSQMEFMHHVFRFHEWLWLLRHAALNVPNSVGILSRTIIIARGVVTWKS